MIKEELVKLIIKIKGQEFQIDSEVPFSYLVDMSFSRVLMMLRGLFRFYKFKIYLGKNVNIKCKRKIRIGHNVTLKDNTKIDALSLEGITIGNNVNIGRNCSIEITGSLTSIGKGLVIEDGVGLNSNCFLGCAGGISIGKNTIIGELVTMHSENHNYSDLNRPIKEQGVNRIGIKIGSNCWLGAKVTILDGAVIESGCVIAAGSVVTGRVYAKNSIYGGIPARLIKNR